MAERNSDGTVCLFDVVCTSLAASETDGHAGRCKQTVQGPSNMLHSTHLPWIQGSVTHHPFIDSIAYTGNLVRWTAPCRLSSALTVGCYSSLLGPQSLQMKE